MINPADGDQGGYAVLTEQVRGVLESMVEIKSLVRALDDRMRSHDVESAGNRAVNKGRISAAHRRIDDLESGFGVVDGRLSDIELLMPLVKDVLNIRTKLIVLVFVSGFLGTSLGVLVLGMLFNLAFMEVL